jgi:phage gp46-like protein
MDVQISFDGFFDIGLSGADLAKDDGLRTAVVVSLFTDRRADPDDPLPDGSDDRRGWWADAYADVDNDLIGSKLWLLSRAKQTRETARKIETYARESLKWLIDDGVAGAVSVSAEWLRMGVLAMEIEIKRPDGSRLNFTFKNFWEAMYAV